MNAPAIFWPTGRNSFHPAWLLVPVPALLQIGFATGFGRFVLDTETVLQLLLGLLWVAPWIWWRSGAAPAWVVQWLKEIRGQMPGMMIALLGPSLAPLLAPLGVPPMEVLVGTLLLGCVLMAVGIFASEFENRTVSTLLGQPRTRGALYRRKHAVLAVLFGFASVNALLAAAPLMNQTFDLFGKVVTVAGLLVVVDASSPLFALLTRNTIAGATFTVAVPLAVYSILVFGQNWYYQGFEGNNPTPDDVWLRQTLWLGLVYVGVCAVLGWWVFLRLEAADSVAAAQVPILLKLGRPAEWCIQYLGARERGTHSIVSLVRKELRLQSIPWIVALLMLGLAAFALGARWFGLFTRVPDAPVVAMVFMGMAAVVCLLGTGASCVAEERQLGTHDWQLTQPASLRRQWRVKLGTTVVVGLLMGCGWPLLLLWLSLGSRALAVLSPAGNEWVPALYLVEAVALLLVSIYTSSFSRSSLKAGVACIGFVLALATVLAVGAAVFENWQPELTDIQGRFYFLDARDGLPWVPSASQSVVAVVGVVALLILLGWAVLLEFARRNHRQSVVSFRTIVLQHAALVVFVLGGMQIPSGMILATTARQEYRTTVERLTESIQRQIAMQRLPAGVYPLAEVPVDARPGELAVALLRVQGAAAFETVAPSAPVPNPGFLPSISPALAKRYGLIIRTNAASSSAPK